MAPVDSEARPDLARVIEPGAPVTPHGQNSDERLRLRLNLDAHNVKNGLGQLALTLVKLLHELMERQAIRRMDAGSLSEEQIEQVGLTLQRQAEEIERLRVVFGLEEDDLNLDLGPLGKLL